MEQNTVKFYDQSIQVCVDRYTDRVPQGRLRCAAWEGDEPFVGLMDFFRKTEELIDEALPQQAFTVMRSFGGPAARMERVLSACGDAGKLATFQIRILFRQNASWQGSVTWLERDQTESFRSALELAFLMDSALQDRDD